MNAKRMICLRFHAISHKLPVPHRPRERHAPQNQPRPPATAVNSPTNASPTISGLPQARRPHRSPRQHPLRSANNASPFPLQPGAAQAADAGRAGAQGLTIKRRPAPGEAVRTRRAGTGTTGRRRRHLHQNRIWKRRLSGWDVRAPVSLIEAGRSAGALSSSEMSPWWRTPTSSPAWPSRRRPPATPRSAPPLSIRSRRRRTDVAQRDPGIRDGECGVDAVDLGGADAAGHVGTPCRCRSNGGSRPPAPRCRNCRSGRTPAAWSTTRARRHRPPALRRRPRGCCATGRRPRPAPSASSSRRRSCWLCRRCRRTNATGCAVPRTRPPARG